jgi:hypothetical protein
MKPTPAFTIDGEPASATRMAPRHLKILDLLGKLPDGELLTGRSLAQRAAVKSSVIQDLSHKCPESAKYRVLDGSRNLYGNPKTVQEFARWKSLPH